MTKRDQRKDMRANNQLKDKGFSLIELSVALIVIGLIAGPLFTYLSLYYKEKSRRVTLENINTVSQAIAGYFKDKGHYPCPAPLNLGAGDSASGTEGKCDGGKKSLTNTQYGCVNGLCTAPGFDRVEGFEDSARLNQQIKIGAVPYRALGLPYNRTIDGYNNKITYAVTERYTGSDYKIHLGAINIRNEKGESVITPEGSAQFVLISHGEDGKGAYNKDGVLSAIPCHEGADSENCDMDGEFLVSPLAKARGQGYFDDTILFKMLGDSLLWRVSPFDGTNIYNATKGNVGIGTDNPVQKLDVGGNIRAMGGLYAAKLCDAQGRDCFSPSVIGGTGIGCEGDNNVMVGIKNAKAVCRAIQMNGVGSVICPPGEFLAGLTTTGEAICRPPSWLETPDTTQEITP